MNERLQKRLRTFSCNSSLHNRGNLGVLIYFDIELFLVSGHCFR